MATLRVERDDDACQSIRPLKKAYPSFHMVRWCIWTALKKMKSQTRFQKHCMETCENNARMKQRGDTHRTRSCRRSS